MLSTIAQPAAPPSLPPPPQHVIQEHVPPAPQAPLAQVTLQQPTDPNQLELNFNTSPYTVSIFDRLENLNEKIDKLIKTNNNIVEILNDLKKKDI
jgi:hypothetical protein